MSQPERVAPVVAHRYMKYVWGVVGFLVLVAVFGITPWDAISSMVNGDSAQAVAFVAGYTLPLTAGTFVSVWWLLYRSRRGDGLGIPDFVLVGAILWASGFAASFLGLGVLPDFAGSSVSGHPAYALLVTALRAYINQYGWALALSSMAIGSALALQVDSWRGNPEAAPGDIAKLIEPQ